MSYTQPKVKLRLCEHLRVQAPHLFTRASSTIMDPSLPMRHQFNQVPGIPNFPSDTPYTSSNQVAVPTPDQLYDNRNIDQSNTAQADQPLNVLWRGKLARNGKKLIDSMALHISGQCSNILNEKLDVINITHRSKWEDVSKNVPIAVFSLQALNASRMDSFTEYIDYFQSKDRIGVAPLGNDYNIYICAPGNPLFDKHAQESSVPILIGIAASTNAQDQNTQTQSNVRSQPENVGDWLNQLNTITAMLGTKK
ncbi:hypothetical protein BEWA_007480 [Theileria equi strain WA]|uniref:Spen paralogue and orthologue SPOC C-terminal domain-containing protein n=1 Tax=Theileria equi strain WA TaxID=1537102 RepID=L0B2J8_THEEQ|nr:hypothetical protein BEWA_007480 [Theileria equi strain WA]AFZ81339.1 hypothetical protein BEWA_007480 [Theileria equi strain WA]|eukprot:XP_004831005.1 hypothetical protein BEWA_007480 [Theileria equi strain WA]